MRAILLALALLSFAAGCGGRRRGVEATTTAPTSGECESVDAPEPREPESRRSADRAAATRKTYMLVFETSCGSFTVTLDTELAPNTAASLVALARTTASSTTRSSTASSRAS